MTDRLPDHLSALVGERHPISTPVALQRAEEYLVQQFRELGLSVAAHAFDAEGTTYRNVVATLPASSQMPQGKSHQAGMQGPLVIAAHYDTVLGSPGADDNASGLAVMLEVARRLVDLRLQRAVRLIGFCLEEEDLLGSLAYVSHLKATGQAVGGAIVLECVGYARSEDGSQLAPPGVPIAVPTRGDFLGIVGNTASAELVASFESAANRHVADLKTVSLVVPGNGELLPDSRRSDHAAFWHYGYPAVMLTDTANFRNPHYHQPTDTLETINLGFMQQVTDAVSAAAIELANPC